MSNAKQPRQKVCVRWATLIVMTIVILVVDALSVQDAQQSSEKKPKEVVQDRITYDGDQVWRIYKPEANSYVNELVQRYDEDGCM